MMMLLVFLFFLYLNVAILFIDKDDEMWVKMNIFLANKIKEAVCSGSYVLSIRSEKEEKIQCFIKRKFCLKFVADSQALYYTLCFSPPDHHHHHPNTYTRKWITEGRVEKFYKFTVFTASFFILFLLTMCMFTTNYTVSWKGWKLLQFSKVCWAEKKEIKGSELRLLVNFYQHYFLLDSH